MVMATALLAGSGVISSLLPSPAQVMRLTGSLSQRSAATAVAVPAPGPRKIAAAGRIEPVSEEVELAVGLVGALKAIYVDEGDAVHRGQLVAELENSDQQARVEEAAATVQLREAELDRLRHGARAEERRQIAAQLEEAAANLSLAKHELERRAPLAESGVASRQSIDQTHSALDVATAQYAAKQAAWALINAPPRAEDVAIAEANLSLARGNLDEQRALLGKTQLRSTIDGVVLRRYLRAGEVISVQPPTPIIEIGDTSRLRVRAEIDEADVARVTVRQRVWVTADAYPGRRFGGVVARISQRFGRKTIHTDDPSEKLDAKILEAIINLDPEVRLPVGLRMDVIFEPSELAGK